MPVHMSSSIIKVKKLDSSTEIVVLFAFLAYQWVVVCFFQHPCLRFLSVAASEGINLLRNTPSILATLQENVQAARAILDRLECIMIPSHPASPIIHIYIKNTTTPTAIATATVSQGEEWDFENEEKLLQDVVEEVLGQGVMITKAKRLREERMMSSSSSGGGQVRPSIRLAMTSALTKKEVEKTVGVVKNGLVKVLGKRR